MREVAVERSVADGTELLGVHVHLDSGEEEYVYARPVGQDTWFHFVGTDSTADDHDPFTAVVDPDRRDDVDQLLIDQGYPVRTQDDSTPPEGQLEILTTEGTQARPFHTHPGTFVVYQDQGPSPKAPPGDDTVHIAILERTDESLRVRVDAPGGPPPEFAIREAALAPYGHAQNPASLPDVVVEN